jgi:hypothetical protein
MLAYRRISFSGGIPTPRWLVLTGDVRPFTNYVRRVARIVTEDGAKER